MIDEKAWNEGLEAGAPGDDGVGDQNSQGVNDVLVLISHVWWAASSSELLRRAWERRQAAARGLGRGAGARGGSVQNAAQAPARICGG